MMGTASHSSNSSLRLLVFTVGGVKLAADAEQICSMLAYDQDDDCDITYWLHEMLSFGNREVVFRSPEILTVSLQETIYRIVIDQPEDIIYIAMNRIQPLPALVEPFSQKKGLWGAVALDEQIILLIDFLKLISITRNTGPNRFCMREKPSLQ
jgi:chemotaxis signal transduction protein